MENKPYLVLGDNVPPSLPGLRPEVAAFAQAMEAQLRKHDDWGDSWKECPPGTLHNMLMHHLDVFVMRWKGIEPGSVMLAAADVANFAMFIVYVAEGQRGSDSSLHSEQGAGGDGQDGNAS